MKFSVVIPTVGNLAMIRRTLPSVLALEPDEVLYCLDHGASLPGLPRPVRAVRVSAPHPWDMGARARRLGFREARNDLILNLDEDILVDPRVTDCLQDVPNPYALVSLARIDYPWHYRGLLASAMMRIRPRTAHQVGQYIFWRPAWQEMEDVEAMLRLPQPSEDTHLYMSVRRKYRVGFAKHVRNVHLRPERLETPYRHYCRGYSKAVLTDDPLWKVVAAAGLYLRPMMVHGFLDGRRARRGG